MGSTINSKLNQLPQKRYQKIQARAKMLLAQEMTLRDIRKALEMTQIDLSSKLHIKQESVSRLEKRSDLLLSTLTGYIKAMGGRLKLIAEFPNRPPVLIHGFTDI